MKAALRIIATMGFVAISTAPGLGATDYTFDPDVGNEGAWRNADNWIPYNGEWPHCEGAPGEADCDTVTILDGDTCTTHNVGPQTGNTVEWIDVQSGGTLKIMGSNLHLYVQGEDSTVDGTLYFAEEDSTLAALFVEEDVTLSGSGTITGEPGDFYMIWSNLLERNIVTVASTLTVEGSAIIFAVDLVNNGTFKVTDSLDTMILGDHGSPNRLAGTGAFEVTAGTLQLFDVEFAVAPDLHWTVGGGTLQITSDCTDCDDFQGGIQVTGGTLDVNADLCTENILLFNGGTIDVADGVSAVFSTLSCP